MAADGGRKVPYAHTRPLLAPSCSVFCSASCVLLLRLRAAVRAAMDAAPVGAGEPYSVCVVGAGGIGALFAARLADAGVTVHCIARGAHLAAIQRRGIAVKSFAGDATARQRSAIRRLPGTSHAPSLVSAPQVRVASATTSTAEVGVVDLVIVALKAWQLEDLDLDLRPLVRCAPTLCYA